MKNDSEIVITEKNIYSSDYPNSFFKYLYKIEKSHFWHYGRNGLIKKIFEKLISKKDRSFLEIGVGTGGVLNFLTKALNLNSVGIDINMSALKLAKILSNNKSKFVYANIFKKNFKGKFKIVGAFDVIEHIDDDVKFLKSIKKYMKNDGYLIITVPADMKLWSSLDIASHHKRRYTRKSLTQVMHKSGLKIISVNYFGLFYYPLLRILRKENKKLLNKKDELKILRSSLRVPVYPLNIILKIFFLLENIFILNISPNFGSSIIVVSQLKDKGTL